jgi:hypothetical protein
MARMQPSLYILENPTLDDDGRVRGRREGRDCPEVVHWPRCNRGKLLLEAIGPKQAPELGQLQHPV